MRNSSIRKPITKILLCVIWLGIIFYNGTREGIISQKSSKEVVKVVSQFVNVPLEKIDRPTVKFNKINYYVRKNAHFFQYLIFSILLCAAVRQFKLYKSSELFLLLFFLLLFPVLDEFIQKYIPGRTSNIFDIMLDFSGGVFGMLIFNINAKMHKKRESMSLW